MATATLGSGLGAELQQQPVPRVRTESKEPNGKQKSQQAETTTCAEPKASGATRYELREVAPHQRSLVLADAVFEHEFCVSSDDAATIEAAYDDKARRVLFSRYIKESSTSAPVGTAPPSGSGVGETDRKASDADIAKLFWRVAWYVAASGEPVMHNWLVETRNTGTPCTYSEARLVLAKHDKLAAVHDEAMRYFKSMAAAHFLPNSPTLTGAGTPLGQLAACFVLPISDDLGGGARYGIMNTMRDAALIQQTGGGVGFDFSPLRPKGRRVVSSCGQASGPCSFIKIYDAAFGGIAQGGIRRGACMAVLGCDHPDIYEFIALKADPAKRAVQNFNISISATDAFMRAALGPTAQYDSGATADKSAERRILETAAEATWRGGDPGMLFIDEANRRNPVPHLYTICSTNPCITGDSYISIVNPVSGITSRAFVTELVGKPFTATFLGRAYPSDARGFFPTGVKDILALTTASGKQLRLTHDHPVLSNIYDRDMLAYQPGYTIACVAGVVSSAPDKTEQYDREFLGQWVTCRFVNARDLCPGMFVCTETSSATVSSSSLCLDQIVSIEPAGREQVFDCVIDGAHAFSANGIYVHNCGEQFLGPNECCCLGSINLSKFISHAQPSATSAAASSAAYTSTMAIASATMTDTEVHEKIGYDNVRIQWDELAATTAMAVDFLDSTIEANRYIMNNTDLRASILATRRVGVGIMGFADLLFRLGIRYGSPESLAVAEQIMSFVRYHALLQSARRAKLLGPFGEWRRVAERESAAAFIARIWPASAYLDTMSLVSVGAVPRPDTPLAALIALIDSCGGLRNAAVTTIAPTGTLSTIAGCEGYGCEPVYSLAYQRKILRTDGSGSDIVPFSSPALERHLAAAGIAKPDADDIIRAVAGHFGGSVARYTTSETDKVPDQVPDSKCRLSRLVSACRADSIFVGAMDIPHDEHILTMAAFQKHVCNAISKTINMPHSATIQDIIDAVSLAWKLGCKGITIFRDGCRDDVILSTSTSSSSSTVPAPSLSAPAAPDAAAAKPEPKTATVAIAVAGTKIDTEAAAEEATPQTSGSDLTPPWQRNLQAGTRVRPSVVPSLSTHIETGFGTLNMTLTYDENGPLETFANIGYAGSDLASVSEAIGRLCSTYLRMDSPSSPDDRLEQIIKQLGPIAGNSKKRSMGQTCTSFPNGVAMALSSIRDYMSASSSHDRSASSESEPIGTPHPAMRRVSPSTAAPARSPSVRETRDLCPGCHNNTYIKSEGCGHCENCSFSSC